MSDPGPLALFPLQTVLFPGGRLPLRIFERRYVDLVRDCMHASRGFGVIAIRRGREVGAPALPFELGTLAEIVDWDQGRDGLLRIVARGSTRFRVLGRHARSNGLLEAKVEWLEEDRSRCPLPAEFAHLGALLAELAGCDAASAAAVHDDALELVFRLAERLPLDLATRSALLESRPVSELLTALDRALRGLTGGGGPHGRGRS